MLHDLVHVLDVIVALAQLSLAVVLLLLIRRSGRRVQATGAIVVMGLVLVAAVDIASAAFGEESAPVALVDILLLITLGVALVWGSRILSRIQRLEDLLQHERELREHVEDDRDLAMRDRLGMLEP